MSAQTEEQERLERAAHAQARIAAFKAKHAPAPLRLAVPIATGRRSNKRDFEEIVRMQRGRS